MSELEEGILVAAATESVDALRELVADWRVTAEALADPKRRAILLGLHERSDFVELPRPE